MPNLTEKLADTVSSSGVHVAYGAPVELEGGTVLPVAIASYGFGGGEGASADDSGEGSAGGGGGFALPVGAYVTRDGYTRFEPNTIALLAVGIPFVCVAGRAISRVIRALKR